MSPFDNLFIVLYVLLLLVEEKKNEEVVLHGYTQYIF